MPGAAPVARRPERTARTRKKLFDAALAVMSEKGPSRTTVEEVADRAGVAKGTVYYTFGSKQHMVEGLLSSGIDLVLERFGEAAEQAGTALESLHRGILAALVFLEQHPGFARLAVAEIWHPGTEMSGPIVAARTRLVDRVAELVQALAAEHELPSFPEARSVAVGVFGAAFMLSMDRELLLSAGAPTRSAEEAALTTMALVEGWLARVPGPLAPTGT